MRFLDFGPSQFISLSPDIFRLDATGALVVTEPASADVFAGTGSGVAAFGSLVATGVSNDTFIGSGYLVVPGAGSLIVTGAGADLFIGDGTGGVVLVEEPVGILVRSIFRQCSILLNDYSPQYTRHSEVEFVDWLNDAQRAIHTYLPAACSRVDSVRMVPGTLQSIASIPASYCKPGDGTVPVDPIAGSLLIDISCFMGADGMTEGLAIRNITDGRDVLDDISPSWRSSKALVPKNFIYDPRTPRNFLLHPGAHATTPVWVRMHYVAMPTPVADGGAPGSELYAHTGASTVIIGVPEEYSADIVNYICARALMKNAQYVNTTNAMAFANLFMGAINAKAQAIAGYNPNLTSLPFAPTPIGAA